MRKASDAGIRLNIGTSGAGKTWLLREETYRATLEGIQTIVIDTAEEWRSVPESIAPLTLGCHSVEDAVKGLSQGKHRLAIVRTNDAESAGEDACQWAISDEKIVRGISISEAHIVWPNNCALGPGALKAATAWRHRNVAMWLDTQRPQQIHKVWIAQARELSLFAVAGQRDLDAVRDIGGQQLEDLVREASKRLEDFENGKNPDGRGWHVKLGISKLPPYTLVQAKGK